MNLRLFGSLHAVTAALILGVFIYWRQSAQAPLGRAPGMNVPFLLWTGWIAFALYLVLYGYALRKYAHKLRISPELGFKLPSREERERRRAACEDALSRLSRLRVRVADGELRAARSVRREARAALRRAGAHRVLRVQVRRGGKGEPPFTVLAANREPIGRVAKWMHAHIFYGLAAAGLVVLHGGLTFASPMAWLLNGLSLLVIGTGLAGIALWVFGPAWLTRREADLSLEKAFALREHYARKCSEAELDLLQAAKGAGEPQARDLAGRALALAGGPDEVARGARLILEQAPVEIKPRVADLVILRSQALSLEAAWRVRDRVRFWINAWRLVHVPASIVLFAVLIVHALSVWWY